MELVDDLPRRAAVLEEAQHLGLARRQRRVRRGGVNGMMEELAEDPDDPLPAHQWHRAHLDGHSLPVGVDEHQLGVRHRRRTRHLLREQLAREAAVLRRDQRRELPAMDVADDPERGGIEPADHARRVDDVRRDVDTLECPFHVAADRLQPGHVSSVQAPLQRVKRR